MAASALLAQASFIASKPSFSGATSTVGSSTFNGVKLTGIPTSNRARVECSAKGTDRWAGLGRDISDDQQDIARGKGMVDSAFQGGWGQGTQVAVLNSWDYVSQGQRNLSNITTEGFYIAPAFMDKLVIHICKNFMNLPNIRVPLILGIWGGKGQGKSFQCELVFAKMGITPIMLSAGELESGNAGEPAKLIRQRYREASDIIRKGKMSCLFINDLDAGAGRLGGTTQYTVNNQMVNATLMNIADNPTNVQMPGNYNKEEIPRVPIIVTGNDFSTLYAPLIRDGRMEKFYWAPTREDRIGVCLGIFKDDNVSEQEVTTVVDSFPGQSIDFFGALRARVYDDLVREWVSGVGIENMGKKLVNSRDGPPTFEKPKMTLDILVQYGQMLVDEQENVKRVQLADMYLEGAALGNANDDAIRTGKFGGDAKISTPPTPSPSPSPSYSNGAAARAPAPPAPAAYTPPAPASPPSSYSPPAPAATPTATPSATDILRRKSLAELRALARVKGVRGDTKEALIKALSGAGGAPATSPSSAPASYTPAPTSTPTPVAVPANDLSRKSLSELRALARAKGLRGDTKDELIKLLSGPTTTSVAPPPPPPPPPAYTPSPAAAASPVASADILSRKSLSELRALARLKGVRGDTKDALIKALSSGTSAPSAAAAASPAPPVFSAPVVAAPAVSKSESVRSLELKSLSELRTLARAQGLRGDTKAELLKLLSGSGSAVAAPAAPAAASSAAPVGVAAKAALARQLQTKSLTELKAMAVVRGIRAMTKSAIIQELTR